MAVGKLDRIRPLVALQAHYRVGGSDFRAEFLRLDQGSRGERQSGYPGGKAQVVFDLGARSRLAPGRPGLEDQNIQPFRGSVNPRGQTGRTGTDYDDIANSIIIDLLIHAEIGSNFLIAGILEYDRGAAHHHRQVLYRHVKPLEQIANRNIGIDIEVDEWIGIAGQELLQPQGTGRVPGAQ